MAINTAGQTITGNNPPTDTRTHKMGKIVFDATSITAADSVVVTLGFTPKYVRWENATDRVMIEWFEGLTAGYCQKTAANGTRTAETTNGGITVCDADGTANANGRSFAVLQNATLGAIAASKTCYWMAWA